MQPMRKSDIASDRMKRLELVLSLRSTTIAQKTKLLPTTEKNEKAPRKT